MPTTESKLLDQQAVDRIHREAHYGSMPTLADIDALCATVKHLRAENEQLKASATFWQAEALLEHFCSEHAKNTRQAGHYCTICAKPFVMSTPPDTRPPKYKDLQTENAELQSQLEQLRAENERLTQLAKEAFREIPQTRDTQAFRVRVGKELGL